MTASLQHTNHASTTTADPFNGEHGFTVLVDKPLSWTSFDVVKKIRGISRCRKVGHAGTLDPLATGLLIVCGGKKTKLLNNYLALPKTYSGTFRLGITTPSHDLETAPSLERPTHHIGEEHVRLAMRRLTGRITQKTPLYSAIKKDGKSLYKYARKGFEVETPSRTIDILSFELTGYTNPDISFSVECSSGTYIRSLVHDIGELLQCGAVLTSLRRERIGEVSLHDAWDIKELEKFQRPRIS